MILIAVHPKGENIPASADCRHCDSNSTAHDINTTVLIMVRLRTYVHHRTDDPKQPKYAGVGTSLSVVLNTQIRLEAT